MVVELNWKTLPLGGIAWTLFWIGWSISWIIDPEIATPMQKFVAVILFASMWLGGIAFWRFARDLIKSRNILGFGKR